MNYLRNAYRVIRSILFAAILIVASLYVLLYVAISLPPVQNEIRKVAERELSTLLTTKVSIGGVDISPAGEVRLADVTVPTPKGEKCAYIQRLGAGIDLWRLIISGEICITYGEIVGLDAYLSQEVDKGPWNIQFIIDALKPKDPSKPPTKFDLELQNVVIRKSNIAVDRLWKPTGPSDRIDFNHLRIENLRADLTLPQLKNDDFIIDLRRLSLHERSGFDLEKLACSVHITPQLLDIKGLVIEFPNTKLNLGNFYLRYDGYNKIGDALRDRRYAINLDNIRIVPYDFRAFLPELSPYQSPIVLNIKGVATRESVSIDNLSLRGDSYGFDILARLEASGFSNPQRLKADVSRIAAKMSPEAVEMVLKLIPGLAPKPRDIISRLGGFTVDASGSLAPGLADIEGRIATGIGALETNGRIDWSRKGALHIVADVATPGLEVGQLLDDSRFGQLVVNAEGDVVIAGGDIDGHATVNMPSFQFNGQQISNLVADVTKSGKSVEGKVDVQATGLTVNAEGSAVIDGKNSIIDASAAIANFEPAAIGLGQKLAGYTFSGNVTAHVNGLDPETFTGSLEATDLDMQCPKGPLHVNSLTVNAENYDREEYPQGGRRIDIRNDFFDATFSGHFDVARLPRAATALAARALPSLLPQHLTEADYNSQQIDATIHIYHDNTLLEYFNAPVTLLTDIDIDASIDGHQGLAQLNLAIPYLQQGADKLIRNTYLQVKLDGDHNLAMLDAGTLLPGKNDTDVAVGLSALGIDDRLTTKVNWDLNRQKKYRGEVSMEVAFGRDPVTGRQSFGALINPSRFEVADAVWNVGEGKIDFADGRLTVEGVSVWHGDQFVNINGAASKSPDDIVTVDMADIDLDYIFQTLNINYVTFGGHATGRAVASSVFDFKNMDAHTENLHVKGLTYNGGLLGDADLSGRFIPRDMKVEIGADIRDKGRPTATVDGGIWVKRDSLSFDMNTDKINIKFLQPFMQAFTSDVNGRASGHVKLFGTFKDIDMTGAVFADTLSMKVDYTNVYYSGSDSVYMTPGRITIPNFQLHDRYGHTATLNGYVAHRYFHDPTFEFRVRNARDLLCYNTDARMNPDWYGTIYGNGGGTISGRPGYVGIMIDMAIAPKSVFNFVLNDAEAIDDYQFLSFSDRRTAAADAERLRIQAEAADTVPGFVKAFRNRKKQEQKQQDIPSVFALDIRASVNPSGEMVLVMDPVGGDKIRAHGTGALQLGYSSDSDELTMYGKYVLADGTYNFTLQDLIIKDFTIRPGSSIQFNGDPLKAILDINAIYRVNTSLTDLDKSFANDRELNRTNVPVDAVLSVRGDIEQPDITFDIELPTLTSDVARKVKSIISTEDQMSRQIIYLLALNRFYTPEYMGSSSNGGEWASVASATVTSQLTNMLSQLTDKFTVAPSLRSDKGDFSDMEVDVALSSRLLNNRLLINGNFGYRDPSTSNTTFVGDFDIEYLLNRNGNLRLKAYNHFNDQNYYLKSALTTQGIGVVYRKDFDNMFNWLRRRKKHAPDSIPADSTSLKK